MELEQLKGFVETARQKSFTKAAERLFLSQPAVSLQIKALEEELGERLFDRRGRQVNLTDAGRVLLQRAVQILDLVEHAMDDVASLRGLEIGSVTLAASDTNCAYILPPVIRRFRDTFAGIKVQLVDRMSPEVVRLVASGEVDLGLATLPVIDPRVVARPILNRRDVLICDGSHDLARRPVVDLEQVCEYPLLLLSRGSTTRALMDRLLAEQHLVPDIYMSFGSIEVIKRFAAEGLGVAVVPEVSVALDAAAGHLAVIPVRDLPVRQVGLVTRVGVDLSRAGSAFADTLQEILGTVGPGPGPTRRQE